MTRTSVNNFLKLIFNSGKEPVNLQFKMMERSTLNPENFEILFQPAAVAYEPVVTISFSESSGQIW